MTKKLKVRNMRVYNYCELLSNWWFCPDKQPSSLDLYTANVVNCFQISIFVLWQTAASLALQSYSWLWIAFKLVILSYGKQPVTLPFCHTSVVNCFQISNFVLWQTAIIYRLFSKMWLWIAFKLVILSYGKQHGIDHVSHLSVVNCFQISNFVLWQTA